MKDGRHNCWGSFDPQHIVTHDLAEMIIQFVPERDPQGRDVRCHEVVRFVRKWVTSDHTRIVDGYYHEVDHSWLEVVDPHTKRMAILDPYAVGRLPRVQLVTTVHNLHRAYREHRKRNDIRVDVVEWLYGLSGRKDNYEDSSDQRTQQG